MVSSATLAPLLLLTIDAFVPKSAQRSSPTVFMAKPKVFIDGEAGTTGLQVRDRLAKRDDLDIISAPNELRKDEATRKNLINEADAVILCKYLMRQRDDNHNASMKMKLDFEYLRDPPSVLHDCSALKYELKGRYMNYEAVVHTYCRTNSSHSCHNFYVL